MKHKILFIVLSLLFTLFSREIKAQKRGLQEEKLEQKSDKKALEILDKVLANFNQNSLKSLPNYRFKSYEKLSVDINPDSIESYNESLQEAAKAFDKVRWLRKKYKPDTALTIKKVFANSKLFLWERVFEHLYSQKYGEKKIILDNTVAGLEKPLHEMLLIHTNRDKIPKEIHRENRNIYRYFLTDTLMIEGRESYVIRFREVTYRKAIKKRLYNGYLYIDAQTYGIKKIESNSKIPEQGKLTSVWKIVDGKWFLHTETLKTKLSSIKLQTDPNTDKNQALQKFRMYGFVEAHYFDFDTQTKPQKEEYGGYYYQIARADGSKMNEYRPLPLNEREKNTFPTLNTLSEKYQIERKLNGLAGLFRANFRTGIIDWDLMRIINYNEHEGLRLGAGAKLNEVFHSKISPDAYIGYGFKDKTYKFGLGVDYRLSQNRTSLLRASYHDDVTSAGRFSETLWDAIMKMNNAGIDMNNKHMYNIKAAIVSYEYDPTNAITLKTTIAKQWETLHQPYNFAEQGNNFQNFRTILSIKYAPFYQNVMTRQGKFNVEKRYPEVFINFEKAWQAMGGEFEYSKVDFLANHIFESRWGTTGLRLYGGALFGKAPLWHHFTMNGLSGAGLNFTLLSYLGFATMPSGKYYSDKFIGQYFTQTLPWYFKSIGQNTSSISIIHRSIIGDMRHPELHPIDFEKLNHLYQEVGIEWNNFLSSWFNLGVFYRVGHYHTPKFSDNIGIQLKFRLLGF